MPEDASGRPVADAAGWRPVTRSLTYQLVVEAVEAQILTGALKVGDHLPPERELATLLGASRPAVREGMRMLEAQGVLRTVGAGPGSATVVTALPSEALTRLLRLHLALSSFRTSDVVEARVMLERRSAELAAQHATPAELDRMRAALDRMDDAALPMEEFNELDTEFHVCLADAGDNQLVADMTRAIRGAVRDALLEAFRARDDWPGTAARLRAEHRAIYDAVVAGDPAEAADAVERHIRGFWSAERPASRVGARERTRRSVRQLTQRRVRSGRRRTARPDHREGLLGDLQLLVRRHHQHRHARCRPPRSSGSPGTAPCCAPRPARTPSTPRPAHTRARTSASFSPIPAVNTTASSRPSAAA